MIGDGATGAMNPNPTATTASQPSKPVRSGVVAAKLGACCYILWGLWHLMVVWSGYQSAVQMPAGPIPLRLQQNAFHILFFVAAAIGIGAFFNWRNSRLGYWANLLSIGWTEVGLLLIFVLPGAFPWLPTGFIGPLLWVLAVVLTTYAYRAAPGPLVR